MVNILQASLSLVLYGLAYAYLRWFAVGQIFIPATTVFLIYAFEIIREWWNLPPSPKVEEKPLTAEELREAWKDIGLNPTIKSTASNKSKSVKGESSSSTAQPPKSVRGKSSAPSSSQQKSFLGLLKDFWDEQLKGDLALVFQAIRWCARNAFTLLNMAVYVFILDFTFRPAYFWPALNVVFTRVGHVTDTSAKVFFRYPYLAASGIPEYNISLRVDYRPDSSNNIDPDAGTNWIKGPSILIVPSDDFTGVTLLTDLTPNTEYEYKFVLPQNDEAVKYTVELGFEKFGYGKYPTKRFFTFPPHGEPVKFRFASGSCIKANFPYSGFNWDGIKGFRAMSKQRFDLLLFLGDFIYSDVPFKFGTKVQDYRRQYRQIYAEPDYARIYEKVATLHVYDDHEILDNWSAGNADPMPAAMEAFNEYQGRVNPDPLERGTSYFEFAVGDTAFFFLDTRRHRTAPTAPAETKTMLGATQKQHLFAWLARVNHTAPFKFVVSSVPFSCNLEPGTKDSWAGYLEERNEILRELAYVQGVVIVSGDSHEAAVTEFPREGAPYVPIEFSVSPVNQFYLPWAKSGETDRNLFYLKEGQIKYSIFVLDTTLEVPKLVVGVFQGEKKRPVFEHTVYGEVVRS